jgi:hypothetical protein
MPQMNPTIQSTKAYTSTLPDVIGIENGPGRLSLRKRDNKLAGGVRFGKANDLDIY